jgi:hypothetical protein
VPRQCLLTIAPGSGKSVGTAGSPWSGGTTLSRRQAVRGVRTALAKVLDSLPCYCILSDGENLDLRTEYYRVIEVFIPE